MREYAEYSVFISREQNNLVNFLQYLSDVDNNFLSFGSSLYPISKICVQCDTPTDLDTEICVKCATDLRIRDNRKYDWGRIFKFIPDPDSDVPWLSRLENSGFDFYHPPTVNPALSTKLNVAGSITAFLEKIGNSGIILRSMGTAYPKYDTWRVGFGYSNKKFAENAANVFSDMGLQDIDFSSGNEGRRAPNITVGYVIYLPLNQTFAHATKTLKDFIKPGTNELGIYIYHISIVNFENTRRIQLLTYIPFSNLENVHNQTRAALTEAGIQFELHHVVRILTSKSFSELAQIVDVLESKGIKTQSIQKLPRNHTEKDDTLTIFGVDDPQRPLLDDLLPE